MGDALEVQWELTNNPLTERVLETVRNLIVGDLAVLDEPLPFWQLNIDDLS